MRIATKVQRRLLQLVVILAISLQTAWGVQNPQPAFTSDEAISALRARPDARAGTGYQILCEFQPEEDGMKLAQLALEKARDADTELLLKGALVGLLRDGGCLVVEYDRMTDRAYVFTVSDLVPFWRRLPTGELRLRGLSTAGD
jgi:hypothetical protein